MGKRKNMINRLHKNNGGSKAKGVKSNPFSKHQHRVKHQVLGRRLRGVTKADGEARSKQIAKRQQTLLKELRTVDKKNTFEDSRFGERNDEMTEEEKALGRFQRVRTNRLQASLTLANGKKRYGLQDDDEELTHMGTSLSNVKHASGPGDDFELKRLDKGHIDANTVHHLHFGGGSLESSKGERESALAMSEAHSQYRTKQDVMAEIIAKSKMYKAEKQETAQAQMDLIHTLDSDFGDIRTMLDYKRPDKEELTVEQGGSANDPTMDEFLLETRKLKEETRAAAAEKLKSPEDVAKEAKEKLEKLEALRIRRMNGEVIEEEEAEEQGGFAARRKRNREDKKKKKKAKKQEEISDESLGGNFYIEKEYRQTSDSDLSDEESSDAESSDDDDSSEEEEDEEDEEEEETAETLAARASASAELPYTFDMPKTHKQLLVLFKGRSLLQVKLIIERIQACHHLSIAAVNRAKLEKFYCLLLDHFNYVSSITSVLAISLDDDDTEKDKNAPASSLRADLAQLDVLTQQLYGMSQLMPRFATKIHRGRLEKLRQKVLNRFTAFEQTEETDVEELRLTSVYPTGSELMYMQLLSKLYPTSDFRHNIITPCLLLVSECLTTLPVRGARDIAAALFMCNMVLQFIRQSKRFTPEVPAFLYTLLRRGFALSEDDNDDNASAATVHTFPKQQHINDTTPAEETEIDHAQVSIFQHLLPQLKAHLKSTKPSAKSKAKKAKKGTTDAPSSQTSLPLEILYCTVNSSYELNNIINNAYDATSSSEESHSDNKDSAVNALSQSLFATTLRLVKASAHIYNHYPSFPELYTPIIDTLDQLYEEHDLEKAFAKKGAAQDKASVPSLMNFVRKDLRGRIENRVNMRRPLVLKHAPTGIKQYNPSFLENYQPGRDYDPIKERAEMKKLTKKLIKEKKGAVRELRKDGAFLAQEQARQMMERDQERDVARKRVMTLLNEQARDTNRFAGAKKRKKNV